MPLAEPVAESVPQGALVQLRLQVTPALLGSLVTVAVSCCELFRSTWAVPGVMVTTMSEVIVTVATAKTC